MFTIKRSGIGLLLALCSCIAVSAQTEPESLTFSVIPGNPFNGLSVPLITEIYAKVGIQIRVDEIPLLREELMLEQGSLDGVVVKIESIDHTPPELIKIPIPITELPISVFVKGTDLGLQKLLLQRPLRLGILRGSYYQLDLPSDIEWVTVNKPRQLMMMLKNGRFDGVVTPDATGEYYIKTYNLEGIVAISPPIKTLAVYHYVHQRYQHLVPKLTAVLQSMVDDGSLPNRIQAYHAEILQRSNEPE